MTTLFISDLHLDDARPAATLLFEKFVAEHVLQAEALYILGDLFEYWIGDDMPTDASKRVSRALSKLKTENIPCYFMHGNRDFLLAEEFADDAGMTLLPELHTIDLYGQNTVLLHGDTLCTDDVGYQAVRKKLRNKEWQSWFLSQTEQERVKFVMQARDESKAHQSNLSMEIMDVNPDAVRLAFEQSGVLKMIHGHTHRPMIHRHETSNGAATRVVLGDWYEQGSILIVGPDGYSLETYPATSK